MRPIVYNFWPLTLTLTFAFIFLYNKNVAQTPLYLNFGSHNESSDPYQYATNFSQYQQIRNVAKAIADSVIALDARWNMQVESNFIRGVLNFENGATNETDFLQWADATDQIEVDPHNHFGLPANPYNYPDLVKLLDSCGLSDRHNLGGFIWRNFPGQSEDWTAYQSPVAGHSFPTFSWRPRVIWGGGSPGHIDDFSAFGIWKPSGPTPTGFVQHNPDNYLTCIGNGCSWLLRPTTTVDSIVEVVTTMINIINSQPANSNSFYTATIMMNFRDMGMATYPNGNYPDRVAAIIRALQPLVTEGKLVWSTLSEKYDWWHALHPDPNDYFLLRCQDIVLEEENLSVSKNWNVYPNPTSGTVTIQSEEPFQWQLTDPAGRQLKAGIEMGNATISLPYPAGFYFLTIQGGDVFIIKKLIIK